MNIYFFKNIIDISFFFENNGGVEGRAIGAETENVGQSIRNAAEEREAAERAA